MDEGVIELGADGAFDLDAQPAPEPPNQKKSAQQPPAPPAPKAAATPSPDWEIKKQRGNQAFGEGNLDLALQCYSAALSALEVVRAESGSPGLLLDAVALLTNRALVHLKRAEAADEAALGRSPGGKLSGGGSDDSEVGASAGAAHWRLCCGDCDEALALDPSSAKALYRRSRALHALGEPAKALQAARLAKRAAGDAKAAGKDIAAWEVRGARAAHCRAACTALYSVRFSLPWSVRFSSLVGPSDVPAR